MGSLFWRENMAYNVGKLQNYIENFKLFFLGDALGYPREFYTKEFMGDPELSFIPVKDKGGVLGLVSDDSQLLLKEILYLRKPNSSNRYEFLDSWLSEIKEDSFKERASGNTLLDAAATHCSYPSKGSGALTRVPAFLGFEEVEGFYEVEKDTLLTHSDPITVLASLIFYSLLLGLSSGDLVDIFACYEKLPDDLKIKYKSSFNSLLEDFTDYRVSSDVWMAHDILGFIFNLLSNVESYTAEELLLAAIFIDGDSDSVGALIGFIIPFLYGKVISFDTLIQTSLEIPLYLANLRFIIEGG